MLKTVVVLTYFALYQIYSLTFFIHLNRLKRSGNIEEYNRILHKYVLRWAKKMVTITGSTVEVKGSELIPANANVLFVSNHQGNFDIPILLGFIDKPKAFIAKIELLKVPIIRSWMKKMGCLFLDRKNPRQAIKIMAEAMNQLKEGKSLVIFPEGTRSKNGKMGEFKKGSFKIATKTNTIIVPLTINGSHKMLEANNWRMKKTAVKVIVSKPINPSELSPEELDNIHEYVKNLIEANLEK